MSKKTVQGTRNHFLVFIYEVTIASSARDLGLQIDSTLSFGEHITNTVSLCFGSLCQINRMRHLGTRTLRNVISVLVFRKLCYCSPVWSSTSKRNISELQKIQNFAARIITNTRKFDHITPVLQELRWLSVSYYLMHTVGVLSFKCAKTGWHLVT